MVFLVLACTLACREQQPTPPPAPSEMTVGIHRISLLEPEGWEHLDHGLEHIFRRDLALIGVRDLGVRLPPEESGASVDEWIESDMGSLGFDSQRDIASRTTREVTGRELVIIDTWDRLTHDHRRRFAFSMNEGHMLVFYSKMGQWEVIRPAFESMLDSLTFVDDDSAGRETTQ
jgi:hypothetical protein